jgi:hypothetical protein
MNTDYGPGPNYHITQVRKLVRDWALARATRFRDDQATEAIAAILGLDQLINAEQPLARLKGQVRRTLDEMATNALLHRQLPVRRNGLTYYWPNAAWADRVTVHKRLLAETEETDKLTRARWAFVNGALEGFGIHTTGPFTEAPGSAPPAGISCWG